MTEWDGGGTPGRQVDKQFSLRRYFNHTAQWLFSDCNIDKTSLWKLPPLYLQCTMQTGQDYSVQIRRLVSCVTSADFWCCRCSQSRGAACPPAGPTACLFKILHLLKKFISKSNLSNITSILVIGPNRAKNRNCVIHEFWGNEMDSYIIVLPVFRLSLWVPFFIFL